MKEVSVMFCVTEDVAVLEISIGVRHNRDHTLPVKGQIDNYNEHWVICCDEN